MSANLYDILDVDESASAEEIRAAWKAAIADLDPTDRRFRAFNDAAGVLLDPERRAEYDATLRAERDEQEAPAEPEAVEPEAVEPEAVEPEAVEPETPVESEAVDEPGGDLHDEPAEVAAEEPVRPGPGAGPSRNALFVAAVAAVLALALTGWIASLDGVRSEDSPKTVAERSARQDRATVSAEGAAEALVAPVLSYNYKTMAADLDRVTGYLTKAMAAKQTRAWPDLTAEAESQEAVVEASATGTALTRIDPDGERATVVVYLDQRVTKKGVEPFVLRMWATMSLVKASGSEDGWLLDDLCTDASCG